MTDTSLIVKRGKSDDVRSLIRSGSGYDSIRATMADLEQIVRQKRPFQIAALPVISRQLRLFKIQ